MSLSTHLATRDLTLSAMVSEVRNPNLARMLTTAGLDSMIIDSLALASCSEREGAALTAKRRT